MVKPKHLKHLAILASGTGSNARRLIEYFRNRSDAGIALVVSNKAQAPVLDMARSQAVATQVVDREEFEAGQPLLGLFERHTIQCVVLAGFLWKVPDYLVAAYDGRMVNIHPALLPDFGGRGMYGMHVHRAVKESGRDESGITIHLVNDRYDEGQILYQASCSLSPTDTPEEIARKVQQLEHRFYPPVVEQLLTQIPNS